MQFYGRHFPAAAFLSVTPYYNKPRPDGLFAHYQYLAEHSPLPIILYNVPVRTGINLPASITIRLAEAYPTQIIALKDASLDLIQGMEILFGAPKGFQMVSGDDALAFPAILTGVCRGDFGAGQCPPRSDEKNSWRRPARGASRRGQALQAQLLPLMRLLFAEGNPTGIKGLLSLMGLCGPLHAPPHSPRLSKPPRPAPKRPPRPGLSSRASIFVTISKYAQTTVAAEPNTWLCLSCCGSVKKTDRRLLPRSARG
jgi:4-hydroxy-tetrahydrodipicolinate synthase